MKEWILYNTPLNLNMLPGLNPIEHFYSEMGSRLHSCEINNENITEIWNNLNIDIIQKLVHSMENCYRDVIRAKTGLTKL
jgi:hypothetical protein